MMAPRATFADFMFSLLRKIVSLIKKYMNCVASWFYLLPNRKCILRGVYVARKETPASRPLDNENSTTVLYMTRLFTDDHNYVVAQRLIMEIDTNTEAVLFATIG